MKTRPFGYRVACALASTIANLRAVDPEYRTNRCGSLA
jgi:hypothetical protein